MSVEVIYMLMFFFAFVVLGLQLKVTWNNIQVIRERKRENNRIIEIINKMNAQQDAMKGFCSILRKLRVMTELQEWEAWMTLLTKHQGIYQEEMDKLRAKANIRP